MDGKSLDLTAEKIAQLRSLFPEVVAEDKIDFDRLKDFLGANLAFPGEHYELSWAGKAEARKEIQKQTTATLIPDKAGSVNFDATENIFIEGENLQVLRVVQRSYFGKVKMIYIDPPYNTGNDSFVYPDDYSERLADYQKRAGITDEEGYLNKQDLWHKNTRENGQFHSVWLSMMYPRLYLARNLLREDGVIFISIDDNEVANLKLLMDEVFGAENFVAQIVWHNSSRSKDYVSTEHEYILVYAKSLGKLGDPWRKQRPESEKLISIVEEVRARGGTTEEAEQLIGQEIAKLVKSEANKKTKKHSWITNYSNVDENWRIYYAVDLSGEGDGPPRQFGGKLIPAPPGRHWMGQDYIDELYEENRIVWRGDRAYRKLYIEESAESLKGILTFPTRQGSEYLKRLIGRDIFDKPKPADLIKHIISFGASSGGVILDFFAGACTTADAVVNLNEEENKNWRFICVQMPEFVEEGSAASKAGFHTIAEIGRLRIQKAIEQVQAARGEQLPLDEPPQPLGFQAYRLAQSNFKPWRADVDGEQELLEQLELHQAAEKETSTAENMLYELLLKAGLPLTTKIETAVVDGQNVFLLAEGKLLVFFDAFTPALKEFIHARTPQRVVCLDRAFNGNDQALTNFQHELQDSEIELTVL